MLTGRAKAYSCSCSETVSLSPAITSRLLQEYCSLMPSCVGFLEPRKSRSRLDLDRRNLRPMLKISYTACPCLSQLVSAQFAFAMCLAARNRQNIHKPPYFGVQGHWIGRQSRASVRLPISD